MRLLFALPGFHRYDRGAEIALLSVADALAQGGDEVTVMGSGHVRAGPSYHFRHVPSIRRERFERAPHFPPFRSETAWEDATFAAALLSAYNPSAYDAVVTCSFPFTQWALRRPTARKPLQIFVTQNGDWPAQDDRSEFRTFACDGLVCTNPDYFNRNRDKWKCALIPNGVDPRRYHPGEGERARLGLPKDRPIILMVSALVESKRVLDGIRAVAELDNAFLVVAGDGPLRKDAERLGDTLLPDRFRRLTLPAQDMPALYRSADAFLHLSLLESFGNVFLEARATGLPVIAHDTDRLRWIMGESSAYLCDTQNRGELVERLRKCLQGGPEQHRETEGVQRFAWPEIAAQYRSFINSLLEERRVSLNRARAVNV